MKPGFCPVCHRHTTGNLQPEALILCSRCVQWLLGMPKKDILGQIQKIASRRPIDSGKVEIILGFYDLTSSDLHGMEGRDETDGDKPATQSRRFGKSLGSKEKYTSKLARKV